MSPKKEAKTISHLYKQLKSKDRTDKTTLNCVIPGTEDCDLYENNPSLFISTNCGF